MNTRNVIYDAYLAVYQTLDCPADKTSSLILALSDLSNEELKEIARTGELPHKCDLALQ